MSDLLVQMSASFLGEAAKTRVREELSGEISSSVREIEKSYRAIGEAKKCQKEENIDLDDLERTLSKAIVKAVKLVKAWELSRGE